jgi:hypothetical protein
MSYTEFQIMREMHWTHDELEATPEWRLHQVIAFLNVEYQARD